MDIKSFRELEEMNEHDVDFYSNNMTRFFYSRRFCIYRIRDGEEKRKLFSELDEYIEYFTREMVKYINFKTSRFLITRRHSF